VKNFIGHTSSQKRLLIVEPFGEGHQFTLYVPAAIRGIREKGLSIDLLTTYAAANTPAFKLMQEELGDDFTVHLMAGFEEISSPSTPLLIYRQISWWLKILLEVRLLYTRERLDFIYVPSCDWLLHAIEIFGSPFGSLPYVLLTVSPTFHRAHAGLGDRKLRDNLYRWLFQRLIKRQRLHAVFSIDSHFVSYCHDMLNDNSEKVRYIPDFACFKGSRSRLECRTSIGINKHDFVILVYGALTSRKGLDSLIRAMNHLDFPTEVYVLAAGVPDDSVRTLFETPSCRELILSGRLMLRPFFHSTQDEYSVFRSSNAVWLGYDFRFTASSGVMHLAIQAGVPVIASDKGIVGQTVRRYGLGELIDPTSDESVVKAVRSLFEKSEDSGVMDSRIAEFCESHSEASHAAVIVDAFDCISLS
jgi:glycosyltransferase involved in cell wall biosynthesis